MLIKISYPLILYNFEILLRHKLYNFQLFKIQK